MRRDFGSQSWLFPMPVLIIGTYDGDGVPNAMNAAWGGIHDTNQIGVCIDPGHKTAENLRLRRCFTVSIGDAQHLEECDYVGIVSAHDEPDKLSRAGFHAVKSKFVDAPVIEELALTLECRLISFDEEHGCAVGEIVNVSADESILDDSGEITLDKFEPLCFNPVRHTYHKIGAVAGTAFEDGMKLK